LDDKKIESIYQRKYKSINGNDTLSSIIHEMKKPELPALIVEDEKGNYNGILTRRLLKKFHSTPTDVKVRKLCVKAPKVHEKDKLSEAARLMIESQIPLLPVYAGEQLRGYISIDDILKNESSKEWSNKKIDSVMTEDPLTARHNDSIARVLDLFNTYGISHMPVTENGKLRGIVSIHNIIDVIYGNRKRQDGGYGGRGGHGGYGERKGEKSNLLSIDTQSVMTTPVVVISPTDTLKQAEKLMREHSVSSLIVMENELVTGMLTKRDLLQPIAQASMEKRRMSIQFSVKPGIRMTDEEKIAMRREFDSFANRYRDVVGIGGLFVYIKRYGSVSKGDQLIQCRLQFRTSKAQYYSSAESWSVEEAYSLALDRLERKIIEHKDTKLSKEHAQRHIKRLLEEENL
jgi:CBS domain-containing protein